MTKYHTIISGAGPAGLACASLLAKNGRKVLILERQKQVGPKVCAGGITWSGIINLVPDDLIERSFPKQHVFTTWQKTIITGTNPLIATIGRQDLGQWMLQEALEAGAEIRTSETVRELSTNQIRTNSETLEFSYLVAADGSSSTVRRLMGIPTEMVGYGINFFVPGDFPAMEWHLNDKFFSNGYAWVFPHKESASIGAYVSRGVMKPTTLLKNFHLWTEKRGINLGQSQMTSARINYDFRGWRFGNRFLAGDAAGLASALTGEGIYPAIISGEETARAILDPDYQSSAMKKLLQRHAIHRRIVLMTSGNRLACRIVMEIMVTGLRTGIVPFSALEMAS